MEDLRAIRAGVCNDEERAKCKDEFGHNLEWSCKNCPKGKAEDLHPYTLKLLGLRELSIAGYPFGPNDLTAEEWHDLGKVIQWLEIPAVSKSKST